MPAPQPPHHPRRQPGQHGDVQARDAHQVRHTGDAKQVPVVAFDGRLVAHGQRRQHAGHRRRVDPRLDGVAPVLARPLDPRSSAVLQTSGHITGPAAHTAAGPDALLKQPQLQVRAVRVQAAVGLLQAGGQLPALPRPDRLGGATEHGVVVEAPVPAQRHPARHLHGLAQVARRLHLKHKPRAFGPLLRQRCHRAHQRQILAFQRRWQCVKPPHLRAQVGGAPGQRQGRQGPQRQTPPTAAAAPGQGPQQEGWRRQPGPVRPAPQRWHLQLQATAHQPAQPAQGP